MEELSNIITELESLQYQLADIRSFPGNLKSYSDKSIIMEAENDLLHAVSKLKSVSLW